MISVAERQKYNLINNIIRRYNSIATQKLYGSNIDRSGGFVSGHMFLLVAKRAADDDQLIKDLIYYLGAYLIVGWCIVDVKLEI